MTSDLLYTHLALSSNPKRAYKAITITGDRTGSRVEQFTWVELACRCGSTAWALNDGPANIQATVAITDANLEAIEDALKRAQLNLRTALPLRCSGCMLVSYPTDVISLSELVMAGICGRFGVQGPKVVVH